MKNLGVAFLALVLVRSALAQIKPSSAAPSYGVATRIQLYPLPIENIGQSVREVLNEVAQDDAHRVSDLIDRADDALPYLSNFKNHPNPQVRCVVARVAEAASDSRGLPLLIEMVGSGGSSGLEAVELLFTVANHRNLVSSANDSFKKQLMGFVKRNPHSVEAILLLSRARGDARLLQCLRQLRVQHPAQKLMFIRGGESSLVSLPFCVDIALSELGDATATRRVEQAITKGSVNNIEFLLRAGRYVNNKVVVTRLVTLLQDRRPHATEFCVMSTSPQAPHRVTCVCIKGNARVCDMVYNGLAYKFGLVPVLELRLHNRIADDIISGAVPRFQAAIRAMAIPPKQQITTSLVLPDFRGASEDSIVKTRKNYDKQRDLVRGTLLRQLRDPNLAPQAKAEVIELLRNFPDDEVILALLKNVDFVAQGRAGDEPFVVGKRQGYLARNVLADMGLRAERQIFRIINTKKVLGERNGLKNSDVSGAPHAYQPSQALDLAAVLLKIEGRFVAQQKLEAARDESEDPQIKAQFQEVIELVKTIDPDQRGRNFSSY